MFTTITGQATDDQLALICATERADAPEQWAGSTDDAILDALRNTLTLPGEGAAGGTAVVDDGSPFAAALIAFLTPPAVTVEKALAEFVDTFSNWDTAGDVAARLNCGEVDALAGLLRAAGRGEAADLWIAEHATDDDEGDAHYTPEGSDR